MGANATTFVPAYVAGEVLTAANLSVTNSGIPVFATTVTRDAAFGGTGEKTLAEGQFAYIEATNTTQYYDGAAWQSVGVAPGLVFITSATASAVNTVSVNNCFTSTYENYFITFTKSASVGTDAQLTLRLRAASTDSTTNYKSQNLAISNATVSANADPAGTDEWRIGYTNAANVSELCTVGIFAPQTTSTTRYVANAFFVENAGSPNSYFLTGTNSAAASYDGFTILTGGTNISGTIRVYGYVNS
jgi:hypothetical protein